MIDEQSRCALLVLAGMLDLREWLSILVAGIFTNEVSDMASHAEDFIACDCKIGDEFSDFYFTGGSYIGNVVDEQMASHNADIVALVPELLEFGTTIYQLL